MNYERNRLLYLAIWYALMSDRDQMERNGYLATFYRGCVVFCNLSTDEKFYLCEHGEIYKYGQTGEYTSDLTSHVNKFLAL